MPLAIAPLGRFEDANVHNVRHCCEYPNTIFLARRLDAPLVPSSHTYVRDGNGVAIAV